MFSVTHLPFKRSHLFTRPFHTSSCDPGVQRQAPMSETTLRGPPRSCPSPVSRSDHTLGNSENLQKMLFNERALKVLIGRTDKRNFELLTLLEFICILCYFLCFDCERSFGDVLYVLLSVASGFCCKDMVSTPDSIWHS